LTGIETRLRGIVGIDGGGVDVVQGSRGLRGIDFHDLELPWIFDDVGDGRLESNARLEFQHALVLQQQQNPAAIGRVVGNRQRRACRDRIPALVFLRVDAYRKIDGQADRFDLVTAVRLLVVEIGLILKRIGLQVARVQRRIGHHVVGELDDLDIETILRGDRLDGFEDLGVRAGGRADLDGFGAGCGRDGDQGDRRDDEMT
jgi:hypothetical protein